MVFESKEPKEYNINGCKEKNTVSDLYQEICKNCGKTKGQHYPRRNIEDEDLCPNEQEPKKVPCDFELDDNTILLEEENTEDKKEESNG